MASQVSKTRFGEMVLVEELPDVLDRVQLWRVRRQGQQADVAGHDKSTPRLMPAGAGECHDGMGAGSCLGADLGQMQVHCRDVDAWQHEGGADAACRTDRTGQPGGTGQTGAGVALIMWCPRSAAAPGPDTGQAALPAEARVRRENSSPDCFPARLTLATRARPACPGRARG